jgi:hypothetical protein
MNPTESQKPYTSLEKDILSESFVDMQKMIFKIVWGHYRAYGGDLDSLMSEGQLGFLQAHAEHDEKKGALSTYVHQIVNYRLMDFERQRLQEQNRCCVVSLESPGTCEEAYQIAMPEKEPNLASLLLQVGEDCKNIVHLILHPPHDFCEEMNEYEKPVDWKNCLQEYLHFRMKWSLRRISTAFDELKEALTEK